MKNVYVATNRYNKNIKFYFENIEEVKDYCKNKQDFTYEKFIINESKIDVFMEEFVTCKKLVASAIKQLEQNIKDFEENKTKIYVGIFVDYQVMTFRITLKQAYSILKTSKLPKELEVNSEADVRFYKTFKVTDEFNEKYIDDIKRFCTAQIKEKYINAKNDLNIYKKEMAWIRKLENNLSKELEM